MAKEKKEKTSASFSDLNDALNLISPNGSILEKSTYAKIDEWIGTGSFILNAALSGSLFGGMPNRRSLCLAGATGTGKTYLAMSIVRSAQAMGYNVVYCDSEGAIDIEFVKRLGVDTTKFRIENISTIEEFATLAAKLNEKMTTWRNEGKEPPKVIVVLDSLGNLSSSKEKADTTSGSDKRDMTKQQAIRRTFRVVGNDFAMNAIPLIIAAHTYACLSGEHKVMLESGEYKKIQDIKTGEYVMTLNGSKEVLDTFQFDVNNYLELKFEDDYVIRCTHGHKFMVETDGKINWVAAEDLQENDSILTV